MKSFTHPTVELRFRSVVTPAGRIPMVQVVDVTTGEILMIEMLRDVGLWLYALNYEWHEGSAAIWQKRGEHDDQ